MAEYGEIRIPVVVEAEEALSALEALAEALEAAGGKAQESGENEGKAAEGTVHLAEGLSQSAMAYLALGEAAVSGLALMAGATDQSTISTGRMEQALGKLNRGVSTLVQRRDAVRTLQQMAQEAQKNGTAFAQLDPKLQTFIRDQGLMGSGMTQVVAALKREDRELASTSANIQAGLRDQRDQWLDTKAAVESGAHGVMTADGTKLMAEADAAIATLEALLAMLAAAGSASGGKKKKGGGGGGGGKRSGGGGGSPAREENKALEEQLRLLEQKRRMGEVHTRQEIEELQRIQAAYTRNAEERLRLEDLIFEARARLRDEEIAQLDRLNDGILTALRNRYEAQRDLEQQHLDASIQAWQGWADETVAAIQAQIDALDEAEKQEGRDEKAQKAQRKLDERRMALAFETDDYARRQLEQEIARLEEDWAKQLSGWARDDERQRLQAEIAAVQAKAEAEQDALRQQQQEIDDIYDELTKGASLQAEAQKLLTGASQQDILHLIGSYAPEYEATGKSLGERLYSGMVDAMGGISTWFDNFSDSIAQIQGQAAAAANALASRYYSGQLAGAHAEAGTPAPVTIEQTNNFNTPVASPSAVRGALDEAAEALAARIAG